MLRKIPFHPFLFIVFPLLSLYVANINQLLFSDVLVTILIALLGGMVFWYAIYLFIRDLAKSAFLASIFLFLFFSFRSFLMGFEMAAFMVGAVWKASFLYQNGTWLVVWFIFLLVLCVLIAWRVKNWKMDTGRLTLLMNFFSIVLILSVSYYWIKSAIQISANTKITQSQFDATWGQQVSADVNLQKANARSLPTIYYIILDGYARQDVLQEKYYVDNTPFIDFLKHKGFYVAEQATSNYKSTAFSLSSSLNYMYLDDVARMVGENSSNTNILKTMVERNRVFAQLKSLGYQIVSFSTDYDVTNLTSTDLVLSAGSTPNNFQNTLIGNTPLSIFLFKSQYDWHRQHIQYTLDHLADPVGYSKPTFVFAHVIAPHPPFVLGAKGEPVNSDQVYSLNDAEDFMVNGTPEEYRKGYSDQLMYVNNQVEKVVQKILDELKDPPIIIIQGDHGPGMGLNHRFMELSDLNERMSILNAYYLPGAKTEELYSDITPVNTFRVIFNEYFGANFPLLEDRNYYSPFFDNFVFTDITEKVQPNK